MDIGPRTQGTQVRHKSFLSRRRAALAATICSLLRDKTEQQTHDVSVGLLTQYVSLFREVLLCFAPVRHTSLRAAPRSSSKLEARQVNFVCVWFKFASTSRFTVLQLTTSRNLVFFSRYFTATQDVAEP